MRNKSIVPFVYLLLSLTLISHSAASAADSTSFNPLTVQVTAKASGGVPVGTVVSWPVSALPSGDEADKWLECAGQTITSAAYPELYAVIGGTVPNYQGVFLRGHGSQASSHYGAVTHTSGALGVTQGDATRAITGTLDSFCSGAVVQATGVFANSYTFNRRRDQTGWSDSPNTMSVFDTSIITPTATENRPVNKAVKYLIKAKP